jgi:hypothetical protein
MGGNYSKISGKKQEGKQINGDKRSDTEPKSPPPGKMDMTRVTIIKVKIDIYDLFSRNIIEYGDQFKKFLLQDDINDKNHTKCFSQKFGDFLPTEFEIGIRELYHSFSCTNYSSSSRTYNHPYYPDKQEKWWYNLDWIDNIKNYIITHVTKVERIDDIINRARGEYIHKKLYNGINAYYSKPPESQELKTSNPINYEEIKKKLIHRDEPEYCDGELYIPPCYIENRWSSKLAVLLGYNKGGTVISYNNIFKIVNGKENEFIERTCTFLENAIRTTHEILYQNFEVKKGIFRNGIPLDKLNDYALCPATGYAFPKQKIGESGYSLSPEAFNYLYNSFPH